MQSPTKLSQRLNELLGPPGPDSDPIELALRTVVATTAPMLQGVIDQWTPEQLDRGLELVALFFLGIRSDETLVSSEFMQELARMNATALQHANTIAGTAAPAPPAEIPAPPAGPTSPPPEPSPGSASGSGSTEPEPEPAPAAAPPPPLPGAGTASGPTSPPVSSPAGGPSAPSSPPASSPTTEPAQHPPAPPWG